jgi:N-acetylglucosamine-6-sulfatase
MQNEGAARRGSSLPVCIAALALGALTLAVAWTGPGAASASNPRPNVLVIMSDDQTLDSMRYMPLTEAALGDRGATFGQYFDNYSLCCPSRSTLLTGQYAHNHGVLSNQPPSGGFDKLDSTNTLAVWLQRSGYYTGLIGKYLNGYETHRTDIPPLVPPGYSEWHGTTKTYTYYDYEMNENGSLVPYGNSEAEYNSDVFTAKAVDFINQRAPAKQPFFLWLAYLAPHGGGPNPNPQAPSNCNDTAKPAPRHSAAFDSEPLPIPPNFNEADVSDKPATISSQPLMTAAQINTARRAYRCRIESLLAIDEGIAQLVDALKRSGELENTLIVYTSDNGFFAGEHRIRTGKVKLYEESIHLPLLIRGPGFPAGARVSEMAINADLAPTILEATGAKASRVVDGRPLQPIAENPGRERGRELLIETNSYRAIRTRRYIYAEHFGGASAGATEMYDLDSDPYELQSLHADPSYAGARAALAKRLSALKGCNGADCRALPELNLRLVASRRKGRGCLIAPVKVAPRGPDVGQVRKTELFVNGDGAGADVVRPFLRKVPFGRLRERRRSNVRMRVTLLDGRRLTRDLVVRACR